MQDRHRPVVAVYVGGPPSDGPPSIAAILEVLQLGSKISKKRCRVSSSGQ